MVTSGWEDFLTLGLTEIREFGATSVQIMRRLRALLEEFLDTVRPSTELQSKKSSAVSMPPSPKAGATRSTSTARALPTDRGSAAPRMARRAGSSGETTSNSV